MTTRTISGTHKPASLTATRWLQIGLQASIAAILAVLLAQAAILAIWPQLSEFKPLESYARSALFTFIPGMLATGLFAWLVKTQKQPADKFLKISAVVLLLSFIPDYVLPVPGRTLAASTTAAFLHLLAAIIIVALIVKGYNRYTRV